MRKVVNPFLLVAMAAVPTTSSQAAPVLASTFKCATDPQLGGTVQWADGALATPLVAYSASLDFSKSVFSPLACADGQFSLEKKKTQAQAPTQGSVSFRTRAVPHQVHRSICVVREPVSLPEHVGN